MSHNIQTDVTEGHTPLGFILTVCTWMFYLATYVIDSVITHPVSDDTLSWLKEISLVLAIICSLFTIAHYIEIYYNKWFKK